MALLIVIDRAAAAAAVDVHAHAREQRVRCVSVMTSCREAYGGRPATGHDTQKSVNSSLC